MLLVSGLTVAVGGLANIDRQLALVAHNIANAGTAGYAVEVSTQTSLTAEGTGLGVRSGPAMRDVNTALLAELWTQNSELGALQTKKDALSALDALYGSPGSGNDPVSYLGQLQASLSSLVNDPSNQAGQQQVVDSAQTLATTINSLADAYADQRQTAQDGLVADIASLNDKLRQIGLLSDKIISLKAQGQSTADLESQRDATVSAISTLVDVKAMVQSNGDMLLISRTGMMLATRVDAGPFSIADAATGASAWYPGGGLPGIMLGGVDVSNQFSQGRIRANLDLRDTILPSYTASLDEFAHTLAGRFEEQGLRLFTDPLGNVPPGGGTPAQSGYVGFALAIQVNPSVVADIAQIRDGTHAVAGSATGPTAFSPNPAGGPAGFSQLIQRILDFALGAEVQPGIPHAAVVTTALGPGGTLSGPFGAAVTLKQVVSSLATAQATESANVNAESDASGALRNALQSKYDAETAVDIDAELALMVQLQTAYGANARVISASQSMWDQLLGAVT